MSALLFWNKLNTPAVLFFTVLLILLGVVGAILVDFEAERARHREVEQVQETLQQMKSALQNRLYLNIHRVEGVKALVAMNPKITQDDFIRAMELKFRGQPDLRNIGLARDMVIHFMYPVEGNEAAIGLDYRMLPDQWPAVELAKQINTTILAGPVQLVQGGEGLIARIPIQLDPSSLYPGGFWGFASVVMNNASLFDGAGVSDARDGVRIAVRGRDARGGEGEVFFGDPTVFAGKPLVATIELPHGSWQMGAIPQEGWKTRVIAFTPLLGVYLAVAAIIIGFNAFIALLFTKMRRTKDEISRLNSSFEIFLTKTSDFIYFKDADSRIIFCSQTMADITGHAHWKELIGKHDREIFPEELATLYSNEEKPVFNEGKALLNQVNPYYRTNGETGYVQTNKWPILDDRTQAVCGIFGIGRDITEQRRVVQELERERNLFAEGPVFTMEWDPEPVGYWRLRRVSSNVEKILGYSQSGMLHPDFSINQIIHPEELPSILETLTHNIDHGVDSFGMSYRLKTKQAGYIWVYDYTLLMRDTAGKLTGIRSYLYDNTAQKTAEEALRLAEERLEKTAYELTENIPIGTYTMVQPADGGLASFSFMSSRFLELTGLTREEAAADPLKAFACVHPEDYQAWVALNAKCFAEKTVFWGETRVVVNGDIRWVAAESTPRTLLDGSTVWEGVLSDITERKRAEEALRESLQRFNDLVAHVSVGVYILWMRADGGMDFEYVSDEWCRMNQLRREDVLADADLPIGRIHPEDRGEVIRMNQQLASEPGKFFWEGRLLIGQQISYVMIDATPVVFANGDIRWFGIQRDITAQKLAEQELLETNRQLEAATARANEMALQAEVANIAKTEFLANMSHEIRTPMNAIIGFADLLAQNIAEDRQRGQAVVIARSGHMLLRLLNDVLDLSKIEAGKISVYPEVFSLADLLQEIGQMFELRAADKGITFAIGQTSHLPAAVLLDEARMRQILINLVGNAIKFTDQGGVIVETEVRHHSTALCADAHESSSAVDSSGSVDLHIMVKDTGIGIPDDFKSHLFKAFQQVPGQDHARYGGTGLGLAISMRLARLMNGKITVADHPSGQGSVFTLILHAVPVVEAPIANEREAPDDTAHIVFEQKSLILIVDDSAENLELLKSYLEPYAFSIVEARNGLQALEQIHRDPPRLVLTDIKMPNMSGYELLKCIREDDRLASLPVIAITASVVGGQEGSFNGYNFDKILTKPLKKSDLICEMARFIPHHYQSPAASLDPKDSLELPEAIVIPAALSTEIADDVARLQIHLRVKTAKALGRKIQTFGRQNCADDLVQVGDALVCAVTHFDIATVNRIVRLLAVALDGENAFDQMQ